MGKIEYEEYLRSESWKQKRYAKLKRAGYQCENCGSAINLNVHHITYENVPFERDEDLVVLCKKCHENVHGIKTKKSKEKWEPLTKDEAYMTIAVLLLNDYECSGIVSNLIDTWEFFEDSPVDFSEFAMDEGRIMNPIEYFATSSDIAYYDQNYSSEPKNEEEKMKKRLFDFICDTPVWGAEYDEKKSI